MNQDILNVLQTIISPQEIDLINKIIQTSEEKNYKSNDIKSNLNENEINLSKKKRGRNRKKSKVDENNNNELKIHDIYSDDNLKRKVKTHYHNFIIAFLNMKSKKLLDKKYKFGKISSEITQNITIEYNQKLFIEKIKDVIVKMSGKFLDKDKIIISLQIIMNKEEENEEILKFLNMNYKDLYLNYYLKSNKDTFKGEAVDESFEAHIKKLIEIYGKTYISYYIKNAIDLIPFYDKAKKRNIKKIKNLVKPDLSQSDYGEIIFKYFNKDIGTQTDSIISKDDDENENENE